MLIIYYILLIGILAAISLIDAKRHIIPNKLVLAVALLSFSWRIIECFTESAVQPLFGGLIGLIAGGLPYALIIWATNGAMGAGDMKLYAALGIFFGWRRILCIGVLSILIAGLAALILIVFKIKDRKSHIPMAPFITAGTVIMILFEPQINFLVRSFFRY